MDSLRTSFSQLAAEPESRLDLARAALVMLAEECSDLDVAHYLDLLDRYAAELSSRLRRGSGPCYTVERINEYLFERQGFAGNEQHYYDPRNSFLHEVLDRKLGIPITLSVVYLEVAWRLGLDARGISFPGHFLVRVGNGNESLVLDPFCRGARLDNRGLVEKLSAVYGEHEVDDAQLRRFLVPTTKKEILLRMLRNLKSIYATQGEYEKALGCIERVLIVQPDHALSIKERGLVLYHLECLDASRADLLRYLKLVPQAPDADEITRILSNMSQPPIRLN